ncbi:Zinc finger protein [Spraguea lophii 42_110]|uniref:Zinc finger protein n=1 Tax=Spraguea lophii (strain 42_110) TaxID=1358809 RepID=S7XSD1_SPRLO|nr:Zinc finger protein [Spraguea lophii 42_110]
MSYLQYYCYECEEIINIISDIQCPVCDSTFVEIYDPIEHGTVIDSPSAIYRIITEMYRSTTEDRDRNNNDNGDNESNINSSNTDISIDIDTNNDINHTNNNTTNIDTHTDNNTTNTNTSHIEYITYSPLTDFHPSSNPAYHDGDNVLSFIQRTINNVMSNANNDIMSDRRNYAIGPEMDDILSRLYTSGRIKSNPANEEYINKLKDTIAMKGGECSICLTEYVKESKGIEFKCYHFFHKECALRWLKYQNSCPVCRINVEK